MGDETKSFFKAVEAERHCVEDCVRKVCEEATDALIRDEWREQAMTLFVVDVDNAWWSLGTLKLVYDDSDDATVHAFEEALRPIATIQVLWCVAPQKALRIEVRDHRKPHSVTTYTSLVDRCRLAETFGPLVSRGTEKRKRKRADVFVDNPSLP